MCVGVLDNQPAANFLRAQIFQLKSRIYPTNHRIHRTKKQLNRRGIEQEPKECDYTRFISQNKDTLDEISQTTQNKGGRHFGKKARL